MSTVDDILNKLHKLKQQTIAAPDFLSLQKVAQKVSKIRIKLAQFSNNRQFTTIMDKIELLIKEKNKYFKQKMIRNSNKINNQQKLGHEDVNRTLKYSKSAQNIKLLIPKKPMDTLTVDTAYNTTKTNYQSKKQIQNLNNQSMQNMTNKVKKDKNIYVRHQNQNNKMGDDQYSQFLETSSVIGSQSQPPINSKKNIKSYKENQRSLKNKSIDDHNNQEESVQKTTYMKRPQVLFEDEKLLLKNQVKSLEQKLLFSFRQIDDLTKKVTILENPQRNALPAYQIPQFQPPRSPMSQAYLFKQQQIINSYKEQLNSKNFLIQDLQSKLNYFKSMNDELKNRILNQQRRNEDYINDLRQQIKKLKNFNEKFKKQNEDLHIQIDDLQEKNEGLINQIKKLLNKLQEQSQQNQKNKKSILASTTLKSEQLQRQIAHLSSQASNISKLQIKLQHEQQQKQNISKYKQKLQSRISQLQQQSKKYHNERDNIQLQYYKIQQQLKIIQNQLKINIHTKQLLAEQVLNLKDKLDQQERVNGLLQYQNDIKNKNKLSKLKEIKGLLTQLK